MCSRTPINVLSACSPPVGHSCMSFNVLATCASPVQAELARASDAPGIAAYGAAFKELHKNTKALQEQASNPCICQNQPMYISISVAMATQLSGRKKDGAANLSDSPSRSSLPPSSTE
jgi:hypothetical protein